MALADGDIPEIHHSDRGSQYTAEKYTHKLEENGAQISFSDPGKPTQNAYAERVIRTIKDEEVYLKEYLDYEDALKNIRGFLDIEYNQNRIHSSLDYLTPDEFENQWILNQKNTILSTKEQPICVQF